MNINYKGLVMQEINKYKIQAQNMTQQEIERLQKFLNGESQTGVGMTEPDVILLVGEIQ